MYQMIKNKRNRILRGILIKTIALFTIPMALLSSCDNNRYVDFEIDGEQPFLTMFSYLNTDSTFSVKVGLAKPYGDTTKNLALPDCTVEVFEDGRLIENLTYAGDNSYTGNKKPLKGPTYTLSVARKGYNTISASTKIPEPPVISDLYIEQLMQGNPSRVNYFFNITDPARETNYYRLLAYYDGYMEPETGGEVVPFRSLMQTLYDQSIFTGMDEGDASDNQDEDNQNKFMIFKDNIFDGQKYLVNFYNRQIPARAIRITVAVQHISREYYLFMKSYTKSKNYDEFAEPVQLFTNVKNGAGIVGSYAKSELAVVPPNQ